MPATSHASKKNYLGSRNKNFLSTNGALSVTQAERKKICLAASSSLVEISTKEKSSSQSLSHWCKKDFEVLFSYLSRLFTKENKLLRKSCCTSLSLALISCKKCLYTSTCALYACICPWFCEGI